MGSSKFLAGKLRREIIRNLKNGISQREALLNVSARRDAALRAFNGLLENEFINIQGEKVMLTEKGKQLLCNLELIKIEETEWDGVWRIVAYDIPEDFKKERDYFRKKLRELNFSLVQESLWLHPYSCKEEIAIIAQSLGLAPFVLYLKTEKVPNQTTYLKKYNLPSRPR